MKKTVIFGGSFNPVHLGHIDMLREIFKIPNTDKVILMPVSSPPHKSVEMASPTHRINMLKLATEDISGVEISDFEIKLQGKSYTYNTLTKLESLGYKNLYWVIGGDSLVDFHKWYRYEDILKLAGLIVYKRAGIDTESFNKAADRITSLGGNIIMLDCLPMDVSSTEIRNKIKIGEEVKEFLTKKVSEYITENGIYLEEQVEPILTGKCIEYREKYEPYVELLRSRLTEKRFFHSLAVAKEGVRLAEKYCCDTEKAYLSGLLHDICKDTPQKEQLQLFGQFGIILDAVEKNAPKLWHSLLGAEYIKRVLKLDDPEIIDAVRYHTTAKAGMNLLSKIIFLADFTSEDRNYPGVEDMQKAVDVDLDTAMYEALKFSVEDLIENNKEVHSNTLEAYEEIKSKLR